jgi:hypothetical protein
LAWRIHALGAEEAQGDKGLKDRIVAIQTWIGRHKTLSYFTAATLVYLLLTIFYMGSAITNCTQSLMNFPGDNTAGMIAMFSVDGNDPWYDRTNFFSYPYGESLGQPTHVTAQAVFLPFWLLSKLWGPICGFNLLQLIGFMSAALMMFAFIRWLLKGREMVAFLAGFAVAFTPYLQITSGGHISYIFGAVFIAAIWLFLLFWKDSTWKRVTALAAVVALFGYIDGYFILLGGVLMAALVLSAIGFDFWTSGKKFTPALNKRLKMLGGTLLVAIVFMLPIAYVQIKSASQINGLLADTRDSIQREAQVYGARPSEYILPNAMSPITSGIFGTFYERDTHGSNTSESILSLSLVMLALAIFFVVNVVITARQKGKQQLLNVRMSVPFVTTLFVSVFLLALLFSFPPKLGPVTMPSYFLIETVALWRVLARLSVIVTIAMVILGACGLALLLQRIKVRSRQILICLLIFVVIFLEYLTFFPTRPVGSYNEVPELYKWLKTQQQYKEIAEYPIDELGESSNPVFYNTYQRVHGKKLLNGIVKEQEPYFTRRALWDLRDPQAVPGLRALGIDFITIHAPTFPGSIEGLRFVHESSEAKLKTGNQPNKVWGYAVEPGKRANYLIATTEGFHAPIKESPIRETQVMGHRGVLGVMKVSNAQSQKRIDIVLHAQALDAAGQKIRITQSNTEVWSGTVPKQGTNINLSIDPKQELVITAIEPKSDPTLHILQMYVKE